MPRRPRDRSADCWPGPPQCRPARRGRPPGPGARRPPGRSAAQPSAAPDADRPTPGAGPGTGPGTGPGVVDLEAARRRRRVRTLLVAAAAVVVVGLGCIDQLRGLDTGAGGVQAGPAPGSTARSSARRTPPPAVPPGRPRGTLPPQDFDAAIGLDPGPVRATGQPRIRGPRPAVPDRPEGRAQRRRPGRDAGPALLRPGRGRRRGGRPLRKVGGPPRLLVFPARARADPGRRPLLVRPVRAGPLGHPPGTLRRGPAPVLREVSSGPRSGCTLVAVPAPPGTTVPPAILFIAIGHPRKPCPARSPDLRNVIVATPRHPVASSATPPPLRRRAGQPEARWSSTWGLGHRRRGADEHHRSDLPGRRGDGIMGPALMDEMRAQADAVRRPESWSPTTSWRSTSPATSRSCGPPPTPSTLAR